ncbi:PadR family transcriptional regulator [Pleurocapsales cyanobacterium LEGE 06147]|nr:PadR family transcriptional regulator [Pleurocapsales cyanobacterium LEGE 06147]
MLELAALGLLQQKPLHGYYLKQQLELFMSGCISVNYGSIYPLLKRLEERRAISVMTEAEGEGGSGRKIYSITEQGRILWRQQMLEHPQESWVNARSRFAIKFFFFSYLEPERRIKLLEHRLMVCRLRLENRDTEPMPTDPYQASLWEHCRDVVQNEIQWLSQQLHRERANLSSERASVSNLNS